MFCPDLSELILYKNSKIIYRYDQDYPKAAIRGEEALTELMKYIWLCSKHKVDKWSNPENAQLHFLCAIHPEMKDIDNMWHTFLIFTQEYHRFCDNYLGGIFFHHEPLVDQENTSNENYEDELTLYLSYIYDNLGEATLLKWFGQ